MIKNYKKGFTLIELLVVIAIIAILINLPSKLRRILRICPKSLDKRVQWMLCASVPAYAMKATIFLCWAHLAWVSAA